MLAFIKYKRNLPINKTNLLVSTVARNGINFNLICNTGCCGYMYDVTMTPCAPNIKMYT